MLYAGNAVLILGGLITLLYCVSISYLPEVKLADMTEVFASTALVGLFLIFIMGIIFLLPGAIIPGMFTKSNQKEKEGGDSFLTYIIYSPRYLGASAVTSIAVLCFMFMSSQEDLDILAKTIVLPFTVVAIWLGLASMKNRPSWVTRAILFVLVVLVVVFYFWNKSSYELQPNFCTSGMIAVFLALCAIIYKYKANKNSPIRVLPVAQEGKIKAFLLFFEEMFAFAILCVFWIPSLITQSAFFFILYGDQFNWVFGWNFLVFVVFSIAMNIMLVSFEQKIKSTLIFGLIGVFVVAGLTQNPFAIPRAVFRALGLGNIQHATLVVTREQCDAINTLYIDGLCERTGEKQGVIRNVEIQSRIGSQILIRYQFPDDEAAKFAEKLPKPEKEKSSAAHPAGTSQEVKKCYLRATLDKKNVLSSHWPMLKSKDEQPSNLAVYKPLKLLTQSAVSQVAILCNHKDSDSDTTPVPTAAPGNTPVPATPKPTAVPTSPPTFRPTGGPEPTVVPTPSVPRTPRPTIRPTLHHTPPPAPRPSAMPVPSAAPASAPCPCTPGTPTRNPVPQVPEGGMYLCVPVQAKPGNDRCSPGGV
ncbi:hypothetical protein [Andreprevotia lacus]|jgi:hypothetical protein|nr:hypothetical protein [Andreprevotia lacus]